MTEQQRHLPSASMQSEPPAAIAADLQQLRRAFREAGGTGLQMVGCFRNRFYDLPPFISSYLDKHYIPSRWHQILMTNRKPLVKWVLHGIELPLHQNLTYWPSPTAALEQSLRAEMLPPGLQSSFCPQENVTGSSQVVYLFYFDNCKWSNRRWQESTSIF